MGIAKPNLVQEISHSLKYMLWDFQVEPILMIMFLAEEFYGISKFGNGGGRRKKKNKQPKKSLLIVPWTAEGQQTRKKGRSEIQSK